MAILVESHGGICALGSFPDASAAVIAGLGGIRQCPDFELFFQGDEEPAGCNVAEAPVVSYGFSGFGRLFALIHQATANLSSTQSAGVVLSAIPWYLAVPDPMDRGVEEDDPQDEARERAESLGISLLKKLTDVEAWPNVPEYEVFGPGSDSFVKAVAGAMQMLSAGHADRCVVGAVDSLVDRSLLDEFAADNLLRSQDNEYGFVPGEGAVLFVLTTAEAAAGFDCDGVILAAQIERKQSASRIDAGRAIANSICRAAESAVDENYRLALLTAQNGALEADVEMGNAWFYLNDQGIADRISRWMSVAAQVGDSGVASASISCAVALHGLNRKVWPENVGVIVSISENECATLLLGKAD